MENHAFLDWIFGILMAVLGWLGKSLWSANIAMRAALHKLEVDLPSEYVKKDELKDALKEIKMEHREATKEIKDICNKIINKLDDKADK